jgi:hypothetical protein
MPWRWAVLHNMSKRSVRYEPKCLSCGRGERLGMYLGVIWNLCYECTHYLGDDYFNRLINENCQYLEV